MKKLFAAIALALVAFAAQAGWVEGSVVGVRDDNSKAPIPIFINSYTNYGPASGMWHRISLESMGIPADAKGVFLSGILIITHGTTTQTCDLTISFRAPGDTIDAGNYIGQTIEAITGSGQRSNMSTWAPARNGEIEFYWKRNTTGQWPSECSYGINLSAQSYVR